MQLFELIVKLSSVLHGTSIKLGYHKEYLFFQNLQKTYCSEDYEITRSFSVNINLKDRKRHIIDVFIQNKRDKIIYCLNIKGKATNFNLPPSTQEFFLESVIKNVEKKFPGYNVTYIFVKEGFKSDHYFDKIKTFSNVKAVNFDEFKEFFKTSPPNDFQIKTFFFDTLKANLIKSGFDLKMIVKIFSETLK